MDRTFRKCPSCATYFGKELAECPKCGLDMQVSEQQPQELAPTSSANLSSTIALSFTGGALSLFGRALLASLTAYLVIPYPWVVVWYIRWFYNHVKASDDVRITFDGEVKDVAWLYIFSAILLWVARIPHIAVILFTFPLNILISLNIFRWIVKSVKFNNDKEEIELRFVGTYWPLFGYNLLLTLSLLTIVGWAWVELLLIRWLLENISSKAVKLSFQGSGWDILWRTTAAVIMCIPIIPAPWVLLWLTKWYIGEIKVEMLDTQPREMYDLPPVDCTNV